MPAGDPIIWIDLEMTGLNPEKDRILEMASLVTDSELKIIAEGPHLILHQSDDLLAEMDGWNREHHGRSGLIDKVRKSSVKEPEAQRLTLNFLSSHCQAGKNPLAGNSIHQDRRFIARYMPKLADFFHYRNIDVSSLKELVKRWYPELVPSIPAKTTAHRALDDIRESVEELKFYRSSVFR